MNLKHGSGRFSRRLNKLHYANLEFLLLVGIFLILTILKILSKSPSPGTTAPSRARPAQWSVQVSSRWIGFFLYRDR